MPVASRYSAAADYRMARCQFLGEAPITGDIYAALSKTEIDDTDLGTEFLSDLTWQECDADGYERQLVLIDDVIPGQQWKLRAAAATDFGSPGTVGSPSDPTVALVLYQGTSADSSGDGAAHILGWLQGVEVGFLPFTPDGETQLLIPWPSGGTVIEGPNC